MPGAPCSGVGQSQGNPPLPPRRRRQDLPSPRLALAPLQAPSEQPPPGCEGSVSGEALHTARTSLPIATSAAAPPSAAAIGEAMRAGQELPPPARGAVPARQILTPAGAEKRQETPAASETGLSQPLGPRRTAQLNLPSGSQDRARSDARDCPGLPSPAPQGQPQGTDGCCYCVSSARTSRPNFPFMIRSRARSGDQRAGGAGAQSPVPTSPSPGRASLAAPSYIPALRGYTPWRGAEPASRWSCERGAPLAAGGARGAARERGARSCLPACLSRGAFPPVPR